MQKTAITLGLCLAFGIPAQAAPADGVSDLCLKEECVYIDSDGKPAFILSRDIEIGEGWGDLIRARKNNLVGYINKKGEWVIPPQFKNVGDFLENNELAAAKAAEGEDSHDWGYINRQGEWVIPPRFINGDNFTANGLARVEVKVDGKRKTGYINRQGQWVIPPQFDYGGSFTDNGLARVIESENRKHGYIDRKGEWVIPAKFDAVGSLSTNALAVAQVEEGGKKGYLNTWGEWAIPPKFSDADTFSANGLAAARLEGNGKWGYIDSKGEWVIKPQFYEACSFDKNGIAEVLRNKDDYPAFINSKGKVIMQFKDKRDNYEQSNGLFYTYRDDDLVIVNMQGEKIVEKNHDCGTAYINHYGTYLLPRNREEACREFKKNLQELDDVVTELKNSNTRDEIENGNSDSGLENGTSSEELEHVGLHFQSDPGWEVDSVTLDPPQGAMMTESQKVGSRYQIYLGTGASSRSLAGQYAYSIDLKSNNGNYKQCTGSFKLKNGGDGYTSIFVSSATCGASVHQN